MCEHDDIDDLVDCQMEGGEDGWRNTRRLLRESKIREDGIDPAKVMHASFYDSGGSSAPPKNESMSSMFERLAKQVAAFWTRQHGQREEHDEAVVAMRNEGAPATAADDEREDDDPWYGWYYPFNLGESTL